MSSKQKRKGTTIYLLYSPSLIAGQDTLRSYTAGDSCLRWHICHWFFLDHCLIDWAEFLPKYSPGSVEEPLGTIQTENMGQSSLQLWWSLRPSVEAPSAPPPQSRGSFPLAFPSGAGPPVLLYVHVCDMRGGRVNFFIMPRMTCELKHF